MDNKEILKRLTDSFIASGKNLTELSNETGISYSAIQRYMTGDTGKIPIDRLELISNALGVSAAYILGWETRDEEPKISNEIDFTSAQQAMEFILGQNQIMAFGGYNFDRMSDEQKIQLANKMLKLLRLEAEGLLEDEDLVDDVYEI